MLKNVDDKNSSGEYVVNKDEAHLKWFLSAAKAAQLQQNKSGGAGH